MTETEKLEQLKNLGNAIQYLRKSMQYIGGFMVGEANRKGGLDFYRWHKIIDQLSANADLIAEGKEPTQIDFHVSADYVLGKEK